MVPKRWLKNFLFRKESSGANLFSTQPFVILFVRFSDDSTQFPRKWNWNFRLTQKKNRVKPNKNRWLNRRIVECNFLTMHFISNFDSYIFGVFLYSEIIRWDHRGKVFIFMTQCTVRSWNCYRMSRFLSIRSNDASKISDFRTMWFEKTKSSFPLSGNRISFHSNNTPPSKLGTTLDVVCLVLVSLLRTCVIHSL